MRKMKKSLTVIVGLFISGQFLLAQIPRQDIDDAFEEIEGRLTLNFFNALDGKPIPEGKVLIEDIGDFQTDINGKARFPIPEEDGIYKVTFRKEGYIETKFEIEIMAGTLFFDRISISPALTLGALRIVLDWGAEPTDLDAHLVKYRQYHISYRDKRTSEDEQVRLDRDDTNGYGPETITLNRVDAQAGYLFYVHDYSNGANHNSLALSKSKACVKVYGDGQLLNIFRVPLKTKGLVWEVFRIENGRIVPINQVTNSKPLP